MKKKKDDSVNLPPEDQWPIKKHTKVWCLATGLSTRYLYVFEGRIEFFNSAVVGTSVVSPGRPFYNVVHMDAVGYELVDAYNVFPHTADGHADAVLAMAAHYKKAASNYRKSADEFDKEVAAFELQSKEIREKQNARETSRRK